MLVLGWHHLCLQPLFRIYWIRSLFFALGDLSIYSEIYSERGRETQNKSCLFSFSLFSFLPSFLSFFFFLIGEIYIFLIVFGRDFKSIFEVRKGLEMRQHWDSLLALSFTGSDSTSWDFTSMFLSVHHAVPLFLPMTIIIIWDSKTKVAIWLPLGMNHRHQKLRDFFVLFFTPLRLTDLIKISILVKNC